MIRAIHAGSGLSCAVRRLLSPTSHQSRLKHRFFTARSITVPACGTLVLAVLLAGLPAHAQADLAPGKAFRDCAVCPEMVVVPGGRFRMGDLQGGGDDDEKLVHTVTIKSFAVGRYEVTWAQFAAFANARGYDPRGCYEWHEKDKRGWRETAKVDWRNSSVRSEREGKDFVLNYSPRDPVFCVSWDDAQAYIRWLNEETGERYRLLTEAEWEYAARAGTETLYHFGNSEASLRGNANCGESVCADGFERTGVDTTLHWKLTRSDVSPVGSFGANAFGLHDMHGNVWEWVEDCWHGDYRGAPVDGSAWTHDCSDVGDSKGVGIRVLRGGRYFNGGFRLAQDL